MQPLFWDPMQIFPQRKPVFFPELPKSANSSPVGDSSGQGLKSLLASTKLVPAPRVKDAAEKLLAKLQRNETAVGAPAQAQERWGWDGMGWDGGFKRWAFAKLCIQQANKKTQEIYTKEA